MPSKPKFQPRDQVASIWTGAIFTVTRTTRMLLYVTDAWGVDHCARKRDFRPL